MSATIFDIFLAVTNNSYLISGFGEDEKSALLDGGIIAERVLRYKDFEEDAPLCSRVGHKLYKLYGEQYIKRWYIQDPDYDYHEDFEAPRSVPKYALKAKVGC